ncbi:MAG: hypothetical protein KJ062_08220 [Thermoanaerobaculia bacterium]|nr:hypothetical protein [Thermoanaerobaculia bacterium]
MPSRSRPIRLVPLLAFVALAALASLACGTRKSPTEPDDAPPDPAATFSRVQGEVFTPSCALSGCHAGPAPTSGMDLSAGRSYSQIVGVAAVGSARLRVAPGDVSGSYLVSKIRGDATIAGGRMPLGGPYLSPDREQLVVDWIRRGAPND